MSYSAFTDRELMQFEEAYQRHVRGAIKSAPKAAITVFLVLCFAFSAMVEYVLSYEIFAYLKAPLPGEDASWSVWLFALTGVLMALALHLHASDHPDSFAVRAVRTSVVVLVPLYALGAGLALAAIIYFDGADALFTPAASLELFSDAIQETGSPWLESLAPPFALIFVLGCGGLAIINLYIFHKLASAIRENVDELSARAMAAKEAHEAMKIIRYSDQQLSELARHHAALLAQNPQAMELAVANEIIAIVHSELAPTEQWLLAQQLKIKAPECRFLPHEEAVGPDFKAIEKRVASLRALDVKTVVSAFHPEHTMRSKS